MTGSCRGKLPTLMVRRRASAVSNHEAPLLASPFETLASQAPQGEGPTRLSRRLFAWLVDRDVPAMRERRLAVGDDQRVQFDEAMAFLLVIADYLRTRREHVAGLRGRQQLHPAADMNPGAEDRVVDQRLVHHPLQHAGMAEILPRIERIALADIGEILRRRLARPVARQGAEPFADLVGTRADRLALRDRCGFAVIPNCNIRCGCRQRRASGGAQLAPALHLDRQYAVTLDAGDLGELAIIDRLDETRLDQ